MMKISGAIFDMDGTLLDSMSIWSRLGEELLQCLGVRPREGENINEALYKTTFLDAMRYIQETYYITMEAEEMLWILDQRLDRFYREEARAKDGVRKLLEAFQKSGIRMCVATATDKALAVLGLKEAGLLSYFDAVYSCHEIGKGKESPDIYEKSFARLGTKKEETIVFEDALYAARTAKQAGFSVIGLHDESEPRQEELKQVSDYYAAGMRQVLSCYDGASGRIRLEKQQEEEGEFDHFFWR